MENTIDGLDFAATPSGNLRRRLSLNHRSDTLGFSFPAVGKCLSGKIALQSYSAYSEHCPLCTAPALLDYLTPQALGQSRGHLASQNTDKTKLDSAHPAGLRFALLFLLLFLCLFNCLAEFRYSGNTRRFQRILTDVAPSR